MPATAAKAKVEASSVRLGDLLAKRKRHHDDRFESKLIARVNAELPHYSIHATASAIGSWRHPRAPQKSTSLELLNLS